VAAKTAADDVVTKVKTATTGFSLFGSGASLVQSWINGILSKLPQVNNAGMTVAGNYSKYFRASSPPKEGPLSTIDKDGASIVSVWTDGIRSAAALASAAGLEIASAVSTGLRNVTGPNLALAPAGAGLLSGPRQIAPMGMGGRGGFGSGSSHLL